MERAQLSLTDSHRLLPFLKGEYPAELVSKPEHIENLKLAHVAQSSVKTAHFRDLSRKLNAPGERLLWGS